MLRHLSAIHVPFRLKRPFRISRGIKSVSDTIFVEIRDGNDIGRGESVPYARYNETIDGVLAQIDSARGEIEAGADRERLLEIMQLKDVPLLKIKVDASNPIDAVRAVRAVAPNPRIIVDPNESWSIEQLALWQQQLVDLRVDLLEQPLPAENDAELEGFEALIPLAADESGHVADDLAQLARRYDYVNIKLDKTGGLTTALAMLEAAEREGLVGCMVSSSLSIAPAMVIAQRCAFVDLDGPTWLMDDLKNGVIENCGTMTPPAPGFWG